MRIISVSRRTDIPAYYGEWFMNRVEEGFAGYVNPFSGKKYTVSLKKEDVIALAFWSKNYTPFMDSSLRLKESGYKLFFNYTITGYPAVFENRSPRLNDSIEIIRQLSSIFTPESINWRYDPVLLSDITGEGYHLDNFRMIADRLSGYVRRCYISFPTRYGKVERNFRIFHLMNRVSIHDPDMGTRVNLAEKLAGYAGHYGITVHSCCGDYLVSDKIMKASCIDRDAINSICGYDAGCRIKPTRKGCGCTESTDIGAYNTCPHGCVYCYANTDKVTAGGFYSRYVTDRAYLESPFLGFTSDWTEE